MRPKRKKIRGGGSTELTASALEEDGYADEVVDSGSANLVPDTEGELIDETDSALQKSADASFSSDTPEGWAVCGTCMWNIDSDGALVIKPIDGVSGELESGVASWLEQKDDIKSVLVEKGVSAGKSVSGFLQGCANATSIDLRGLGTSQTEDFSSMLKGCSSLTVLDVTGLDTSNASTLDEFFSDCEVLSFLDISSFDMKNVASMSWMFEGCHSLKTVKTGKGFSLSGRDSEGGCVMFTSSNWTEYSGLWISDRDGKAYDCARVPEGIAATYTAQKWSDNKAPNRCGTCVWNVDEQGVLTIKPMGDMGEGALAEQGQGDYAAWSSKQGEIKSIKVEGKVVAPRKMDGMFSGYSNLEHADLRGFDTIVNASTMSRLFSGCASLESLDLSTFITIYCWGMGDMFSGCPSLRKIALGSGFSFKGADGDDRKCSFPKLDADGLTGYWQNEAGETFREDEIPSFKNATYTAQEGERALDWKTSGTCKWAIDDGMLVIKPANGISGEFEEWKGTYDEPDTPWREKASEITSVKVESGVVAPSSIWGMFVGCSSLVSADLKELDAASVSDIGSMFRGCSSLNSIEFPENGMPRVNDVQDAFRDCASLESIDLSFLKGAVIQGNMEGMFYGCSDLRSVNLSGLDTSKATGMANLFRGCSSLESVELSGMDTSAATSMNCMFRDCANLTSLDLSSFRTDQLVEMNRMFEGCSSLAYLNLSSFDTSKLSCVENRSGMVSVFSGCASLKTVVLGENFTFNGSGTERQCSLPTPRKGGLEGKWQDAKGQVFVPSEVPDGAGTYTAVFPDIPDGWNVCGTCVWGVEGGKLVIKPIDGESGELAEWGDGGKAPWEEEHSYRQVAEASKVVVEGHVVAPVNAHGMFSGLPNVEKIDLSGLDTSRTTNMMQMFAGSSAKTIDVSGFDTSNVTNMKWMFLNCCNLESLDLSSFDTSKVSDAWGWIGTPGTRWSLAEITLGDKFDFKGNGDMRGSSTGGEPLQSHTFGGIMTPETIVDGKDASPYTGFWVDAATGKCYSNREELPSKTTATYRAQRNLLESDFSVDVSDAVYSGEAVGGRVSSSTLKERADYDVAYFDNVDAGIAAIAVTGKGSYTGALSYTFEIDPAEMTDGMVSGVPSKKEATGSQLTPEPTVKFNGKTLEKDKDYTVSYGTNVGPGKGTVTVAAVEGGNFTGSVTVEFVIEKKAEPDSGTGGGGTDPAPTPDPGTGGGSGGGGDAPAPAPVPQQFAVTYYLDGGVNAASNPATYAAGTAAALADPTKEGFEFQGWYADAALTKRVTEIAADASGDVELWAKWKKKEQAPAPTFPDVDYSESSWYGKAVTYVAEKGLITGYTSGDKAGMFGVGDTLTRAQLATILWRNACPDEAASYDAASSKDSTGIAGSADGMYYTAAANWAVKNGVISGYERPDGTKDFAADDDVSFEQLVTILARLCATPEELAAAGSDLSAFADQSDASDWSRSAFAWAAKKGLVEGYDTASGKVLAPGEDVARERVAVVLMRAFEMGILK